MNLEGKDYVFIYGPVKNGFANLKQLRAIIKVQCSGHDRYRPMDYWYCGRPVWALSKKWEEWYDNLLTFRMRDNASSEQSYFKSEKEYKEYVENHIEDFI